MVLSRASNPLMSWLASGQVSGRDIRNKLRLRIVEKEIVELKDLLPSIDQFGSLVPGCRVLTRFIGFIPLSILLVDR